MHLRISSGLYAITDELLTPRATILSQVKRVLESGVKTIQFRDKHSTDSDVTELCLALQELASSYGATLLLNDRVEFAKELNIDGVHIGKDDITPERAREILGENKIIGLSCYNSLEIAKEYENIVDYVAFGAFFSSSTKPKASKVDLKILQNHGLKIPVCAIGGIDSTNIHLLKGADMFACVSSIFRDDRIEENIGALRSALS
jgi:thiamine-phosphate pyrophosphorylase